MDTEHIEIRGARSKNWFYVDNEFVDKYARFIGPIGIAIYISLCRHSNYTNQTCFPSIGLITNESGIGSKNTVRKYLLLLEKFNIITSKKSKDNVTGQFKNTLYTLLDKSMWIVPNDAHAQPVSMEPCATVALGVVHPVIQKETHVEQDSSLRPISTKSASSHSLQESEEVEMEEDIVVDYTVDEDGNPRRDTFGRSRTQKDDIPRKARDLAQYYNRMLIKHHDVPVDVIIRGEAVISRIKKILKDNPKLTSQKLSEYILYFIKNADTAQDAVNYIFMLSPMSITKWLIENA